MSESTAEATGRDARGRFTQGNKGGPGNPHARACAQRRAAILEVVSADDIKDVFRQLLQLAKAGNLSATKLLLLYAVGKPEPQVDPDRLDEDEFDVLKGQAADPEVMKEIMTNIPGETACKVLEAFLPFRGEHFLGQIEKVGTPVASTPGVASPVASAPGVASPVESAPGVASPVASAPGVCASDSASSRGANATPLASANATSPVTGSASPRGADATPLSASLAPEQSLVHAEQVLRQAANSTVTKRRQTAEMRASERHDTLPLESAAQPVDPKPPRPGFIR